MRIAFDIEKISGSLDGDLVPYETATVQFHYDICPCVSYDLSLPSAAVLGTVPPLRFDENMLADSAQAPLVASLERSLEENAEVWAELSRY